METLIPKIDTEKTFNMVTKTTRKQYHLRISNRDTCMGQYYSEDDWDIDAYGDTMEELFENLTPKYFGDNEGSTLISDQDWSFDISSTTDYEEDDKIINTTHYIEDDLGPYATQDADERAKRHKMLNEVMEKFKSSTCFIEASEEYFKQQEKNKKENEAKNKRDKEKEEKKQLKELKEKYEDGK